MKIVLATLSQGEKETQTKTILVEINVISKENVPQI